MLYFPQGSDSMDLTAVRIFIERLDRLLAEAGQLPSGCIVFHQRGTHRYTAHQYSVNGKRIQKYVKKEDVKNLQENILRRRQIVQEIHKIRGKLKGHCRLVRIVRRQQEEENEKEARRREARDAADRLPFGQRCVHRTLRGEYVASKSEVILADYLYLKKISYEYSRPITLGSYIYYPDFTLYVKNSIVYLEHIGMQEQEDYAVKWERKRAVYQYYGIIDQFNLICTYDYNGAIDVQQIDSIFRKWGIVK